MATPKLPTLTQTKYSTVIPSTGKQVSFRAYLIKEERILMKAQESKDSNAIIRAVIEVINSCAFGTVDAKKLAVYDVEFLFAQLRAKSSGEIVRSTAKCTKCDHDNEVEINLSTAKVNTAGESTVKKTVTLSDTVSVQLKRLTVTDIEKFGLSTDLTGLDALTTMIAASIGTITDGDAMHVGEDFSKDDLIAFVDSFSHEHLEAVQAFIESTPTIAVKTKFACSHCQTENEHVFKGLASLIG